MLNEKEEALIIQRKKVKITPQEFPVEKKIKRSLMIECQETFEPNRSLPLLADFKKVDPIENPANEQQGDVQIDLTKDVYTLEELLMMKVTEIPFLVEKILPEKAITFLGGDSDVGKTLFYTQLGTAIAEGKTDFIGLKLNTKYKSVLIISSEDGPISVSVRVKMQLSGRILSEGVSQRFTVLTNGREATRRIIQILKKKPADLVVIDAFGDIYEGDPNSSSAVRSFLNQFEEIGQTYGCAVLIVHHIVKGKESMGANKSHLLGSVGLHGKARGVIMLSKHSTMLNIRTLKIVKGNYISEEDKNINMYLEFNPKTLLHKVVDNESQMEEITMQLRQSGNSLPKKARKTDLLKLQAVSLREEGYTFEEIGEILGREKSTVSRWFKDPTKLYDVSQAIK